MPLPLFIDCACGVIEVAGFNKLIALLDLLSGGKVHLRGPSLGMLFAASQFTSTYPSQSSSLVRLRS